MPFRGRDGGGEAGRGDRPVLWGLVAWSVVAVLWVTWAPYRFRPPDLSLTLAYDSLPEILGNLVLMAPVAVVMALSGRGSVGRRVVRAGLAAVAVSLLAETGQVFIEGRHPSTMDLVLNACGGAALGWVAVRVGAWAGPARALAPFVLLAWGLTAGHGLASALAVERGHRIRGWDRDYPVLAGDEAGGGREYVGSVRDPSICAGRGEDRVCVGPDAGAEARRRLVRVARESQTVEARARIVSESDRQRGPARIVTFSGSPVRRNVTLGQQGRTLVFRVRTPIAGPNGTRTEFHLIEAVPVGQVTLVTAVFDGGRVTLRATGEGAKASGVLYPGLLQGWMLAGFPLLGLETAGLRARLSRLHFLRDVRLNRLAPRTAWAAILFLFPLGYASGLPSTPTAGRRLLLGSGFATGALLLADAIIGVSTPFRVLWIGAGAALAGAAVGTWDGRRWRARRGP